MNSPLQFSVETVDGDRLGKLGVPSSQIADWLNFLITPQYRAEIVAAEQNQEWIDIYFQASEGLYLYLDARLNRGFEAA
jgi:hypothetical protein